MYMQIYILGFILFKDFTIYISMSCQIYIYITPCTFSDFVNTATVLVRRLR